MSFLKIVITPEQFITDEARKIDQILESGVDYVHIRKPGGLVKDVRELLKNISHGYHARLKLHDQFSLLNEFQVGGVHLNTRNSIKPQNARCVSRSCHTLAEIEDSKEYDYITLSPIFDSISKSGYKSAFFLENLKDKIEGKNVIALGGVTPDLFPLLINAGFYGAAMLGCVWRDTDEFCKIIKQY